ncbi:MAG: J domain-containing protein [Candidatus Obscuribacterales bacterium]|nr:J domain-containing protein [Candidatus Obscuribacterales bacterium]
MTKLDWESCYGVLELRPGATLKEVNKAWKRLSKLNHPDQYGQGSKAYFQALEKQKQLNAAHDFLKARLRATNQVPPADPAPQTPPPPPRQSEIKESPLFWLGALYGAFLFFLVLCKDLLRMLVPWLAVEDHALFCDLVSVIAFGITAWLFLRLAKLSGAKT